MYFYFFLWFMLQHAFHLISCFCCFWFTYSHFFHFLFLFEIWRFFFGGCLIWALVWWMRNDRKWSEKMIGKWLMAWQKFKFHVKCNLQYDWENRSELYPRSWSNEVTDSLLKRLKESGFYTIGYTDDFAILVKGKSIGTFRKNAIFNEDCWKVVWSGRICQSIHAKQQLFSSFINVELLVQRI
jgi:hypothetical protein